VFVIRVGYYPNSVECWHVVIHPVMGARLLIFKSTLVFTSLPALSLHIGVNRSVDEAKCSFNLIPSINSRIQTLLVP